MKRYLGIICLLYSGIIGYVWIFNKLKSFLAPTMQIYLKLSLVPIFLIGLVLLFNSKVHYKFKISDLILILPLIFLIIAGDGRLSESFSSNRTTNIVRKKVKTEIKKDDKNKINTEIKENIEEHYENTYDFSNPYFTIEDTNYNTLVNYITYEQKAEKFKGKTIKVRGFTSTDLTYLNDGYFSIGKYAISCCAADAEFIGFIVKYDNNKIESGKWYEIEGILEKGKDRFDYDIMYIKIVNIKEISSKNEEQYIYPCYAYSDSACKSTEKYNLEY